MRFGSLLLLVAIGLLIVPSSTVIAQGVINDPTYDPSAPTRFQGDDTPEGKKIAAKLNAIIIPKVDFDKLDIAAIIDFLNVKSKEMDPQHVGVKFSLNLPQGMELKKIQIHREVSITLENVPVGDVLLYVGEQTNLEFSIINGAVVFKPYSSAR